MTFENQEKLPHLPVPDLQKTLEKYYKTLLPFCNTEEQAREVHAIIKNFQSTIGSELQKRLNEHASKTVDNWLDSWWLKAAYHSWREPLLVNSNWFMVFADHKLQPASLLHPKLSMIPDGVVTSFQIMRAAGFVCNAVGMKDAIYNNEISAETMGKNQTPLCMQQYRLMFGWTRIPKPNCDENVCPGGYVHQNVSKHFTVLFRNQIYQVDAYDPHDGKPYSLADMEELLMRVVFDVVNTDNRMLTPPVCILTSDHRDRWAEAREHLWSISDLNRESLASIESSLFCLCLDDWSCPDDYHSAYQNMAYSKGGFNRWYDKAISIICMSNGKGGMNGEHSPCDALIPSRLMDWLVENEPAKDPLKSKPHGHLSTPKKLNFNVDAKIQNNINLAIENANKLIIDSDPKVLIYDGYGSDFIKNTAKVSPDAYLQMVIQLAYFKIHGKWTATYETGSTRQFLLGRTETVRVCSVDSCNFLQLMKDPSVSASEKYKALEKACKSHSKYTVEAMNGEGVDRHLLGLRLCLRTGEGHEIFSHPVMKESTWYRLSTSSLTSGENYNGTGFGAVVPDGYGTNYCIGSNVIKFGVESKKSCRETSSEKFIMALKESFHDLKQVCLSATGSKSNL